MGSFGEKLRREREMRAITLDEIAEATKIGTRSLKALEDEQFDILPGGIFNKGFVRSYARYLGINEEQAVADYLNAIGEQPAAAAEPKIEQIAAQAEAARNREALQGLKEKGSSGAWIAFVLLIVVLSGGGFSWKYYQNRVQAREAAARAEAQARIEAEAKAQAEREAAAKAAAEQQAALLAANPDPNAANTTGNNPLTAPAAKPEAPKIPIELQIKVTKATWVSIKADDQPASTETLKNAEEKVVTAQQRIVVTTGNALEITCNGKPLGVVGENNKRNVLRFTPECVVQ